MLAGRLFCTIIGKFGVHNSAKLRSNSHHIIFRIFQTVILLSLLISAGESKAQQVNFAWARQYGGTPDEYDRSMILDNGGNPVTTGSFSAVTDFDPGPGVLNLTPVGGGSNVFITKVDPAGNLVWVKQFGGTVVDHPLVATDAGGNFYLELHFLSAIDADPGAATQTIVVNDGCFALIKLDNNGNFIWVKQFGPIATSKYVTALTLDTNGDIFIAGEFDNVFDCDPSPAVNNLTVSGPSTFIFKWNNVGVFGWAQKIDGQFSESIHDIATDNSGAVYLSGYFEDTIDFDPGPGVSLLKTHGQSDIFIAKFDGGGAFSWAKSFGAFASDWGNAVSIDPSGNILITGYFWGTVDFDPGPGVNNLTSAGDLDVFILKADPSGNVIWVKRVGGDYIDEAQDIFTDASGGIYVTGLYSHIVDFDPGAAVSNLSAVGDWGNIFILKLATDGSFRWAKNFGGSYEDVGYCVAVDGAGDVYAEGLFKDVVDFDPGPGVFNLTAAAPFAGIYLFDIYLLKLQHCFNPTSASINVNACGGYTVNNQTYTSSGTYTQFLVNAAGCDSILTINLQVKPNKYTNRSATICEGQSYFAEGQFQTTSGIYNDTLPAFNGCDSIIVTTLRVNPKPLPDLGADRNLCQGTDVVLRPGFFNAYSWQDLSTASSFTVSAPGWYWVKVTDAQGCTAVDSVNFLNVFPPPAGFMKPLDSICQYNKLLIQPPSIYTLYSWSTGASYPAITVDQPGTYTLTVEDIHGCSATESTVVSLKYCHSIVLVPTAFTPNGDLLNDLFKARVYGRFSAFKLEVYDRNGQLIFRTTDPDKGWDGKFHNALLASGVYVWQCSYQLENKPPGYQKGTVVLIR